MLEKLPVAASLQREDFRSRLAAGSGLTMAELVYSVVMALDSVKITADIELGGLDQLLNMQMCRRVMENAGQQPEIVIATGLIEGTDGTGAKMSKSKGNYVGLAFEPKDVFGKLMSAADRLLPCLPACPDRAARPRDRPAHAAHGRPEDPPNGRQDPARLRRHGRRPRPRPGRRSPRRVHRAVLRQAVLRYPGPCPSSRWPSTPTRLSRSCSPRSHGLVSSLGQVRRVAAGGGLRLVTEVPGKEQEVTLLTEADATATLGSLLKAHEAVTGQPGARNFLKCGRFLIETK